MVSRHPIYVVDAFTTSPFHGNPAAVCLLRHGVDDRTLQAVAAEMNLSETAFVRPLGGDLFDTREYDLRWFTPSTEVPLCGHATLATAKVLFDELGSAAESVTFHTKSGPLRASSGPLGIALDFPGYTPREVEDRPEVRRALGAPDPVRFYSSPEAGVLLVRLGSPRDVESLTPEMSVLGAAAQPENVVVVTARGSPPHDIVSRCFAPALGIPEDPVTGMAHCVLGPHWCPELGLTELRARQASARGGELIVRLAPDGRVGLVGDAKIVVRGYLDLPG